MPKATLKTFENVLNAWATNAPQDMQTESARDKLLDSFLRLFENLSAANISRLPPRRELLQELRRAIHWQWIALNIPAPPVVALLAPQALTLLALRWLSVWQTDKTPGQSRLMAALDRDLGRLFAAAQYVARAPSQIQ